jgi:hypothetical protein
VDKKENIEDIRRGSEACPGRMPVEQGLRVKKAYL